MLFPYNSLPAGNKLVLKLTKNTASGLMTEAKLMLFGIEMEMEWKMELN
jgi:hypothetical protein